MAKIEVGEAVSSGFRLIGQRPLSVLMWGLAYMVIAGVPALLVYGMVGPDILNFYRDILRNPGTPPDTASMFAMQSKLGIVNPLFWLISLVSRGVLLAAVYRAVLTPANKGFFYLRLSMDEVWQALVYLVLAILLAIFIFAIAIAAAIVGAIIYFASRAAGPPASYIIMALGITVLVIAAVVAILMIALRFSLAGPMTFADKQFRLFESWTLTKGHVGGLFLVGISLFAIGILFALVFDGVIFGVMFSVIGSGGGASIQGFFDQSPETLVRTLAPWIIGIGLVGSVLIGAMLAIFMAPWAVIYRQLTASPEQAFT